MALDDRDYMRPPPEKAGGGSPPAPVRRKRRTRLVVVLGLILAALAVVGLGITGNLSQVIPRNTVSTVSEGIARICQSALNKMIKLPKQETDAPTEARPAPLKPEPLTVLDAEALAKAKEIISEHWLEYKGSLFTRVVEGRVVEGSGDDYVMYIRRNNALGPLHCESFPPSPAERMNDKQWFGSFESDPSPFRVKYLGAYLAGGQFGPGWSKWEDDNVIGVYLTKEKGQWTWEWKNHFGFDRVTGKLVMGKFFKPTPDEIKRLVPDE